jgi:hypothetical protein
VPELNAPAVASTPDDTPLSTPALTKDPEKTEPLALKPEATARVPEETPIPTPVETPLERVVPLVTTEPLDVPTVPEPDPFPLPERPKASRLVRAPHPVSKSKSDAPIAARTFHIFPSLPSENATERVQKERRITISSHGRAIDGAGPAPQGERTPIRRREPGSVRR